MTSDQICTKFNAMGARCKVEEVLPQAPNRLVWSGNRPRAPFTATIDIRNDKKGQFFLIRHRPDVDIEPLQVDAQDRHLVLMTRDGNEKSRFLCGHDEREWFVAAIPERTPVTTVKDAKDALKPEGVAKSSQMKRRERGKRHNSDHKRQGEFFFMPRPGFVPEDGSILKNEIIVRSGRGGSKPHMCDEMVRVNGLVVMRARDGRVVNMREYNAMSSKERADGAWTQQMSGAQVFVRGRIRHPDHATLKLQGWHEVLMNTEQQSRAMSSVLFID